MTKPTRSYRPVRQAGDTIVEVLICIAIVGAILAGAFITTQRSRAAVRDSQEHSEALKLAEGQLEQLRANANANASVFAQAGEFCMVDQQPIDTAGTNANKCTVDSGGAPTTAAPAYRLRISRDTAANIFTVKVDWDSITGNGQASESMVYRMYQ